MQHYNQESEDDRVTIEKGIADKASKENYRQPDIEEVCYHAVLTTFCHYLYETTCQEGSSLTLAWIKARDSRHSNSTYCLSGSCRIESDTQLSRLVNGLKTNQAYPEHKPFIRKAFNMPDAVVVMPEDMDPLCP